MLRSVRLRITLWYVLLLAVILAAFCVGVYFVLRQSLYSNLDDTIENRVATFQGLLEFEGETPTLPENAASTGVDSDERLVRVFDSNGDITFDGTETAGGAPLDADAIESALDGESATYSVKIGDEGLRVQAVPIVRNGAVVGVLEVGVTKDDVEETLQSLILIMVVGYPLTLAIATAGGLFLASRVLSPIDDVTSMARRISAEDLGQRLDLDLPDDELGRLARTFDEMIARLDAAFQRQRQFTADASHELRTPLTVIKGQVEVALTQARDAEAYREVLRTVNAEVDRLNRMIGSLLTLARADAGQAVLAKENVSIAEVVGGAVEQVRPLADKRSVRIEVLEAPDVVLDADEDLLLQLLLNLLDNAIRHTPSGGAITTGWRMADGNAELWVSDNGEGIPQEHLARIFDRFYRADSARRGGGAGLGLSICKWIAEAHGGSISAESAPGEGTAITVSIPIS
jgi:heavy metal sensor kinase